MEAVTHNVVNPSRSNVGRGGSGCVLTDVRRAGGRAGYRVRVAVTPLSRPGGIALDTSERRRLEDRIARAVRRARRRGTALAALTIDLAPETDPSALVLAS